jgi:lactoylglutathione lyase
MEARNQKPSLAKGANKHAFSPHHAARPQPRCGEEILSRRAGADDEGLFKASPRSRGAPLVELTYNWDEEKYGEDRYFGHLAYEVDDIYATCDRLMKMGITINRPPRDGNMAFVRSPDLHSIELLQKGEPKPPAEPWTSMPNTGHW